MECEALLNGGYIGIVRLQMIREGKTLYGMERFCSADGAVRVVQPLLEQADREMFLVMSLDASMCPIALEVAAIGGLCSCFIDMKSIFKHAVLSNAYGIICFHNHPSGNVTPSGEDYRVTKKIAKAAMLLDVKLIDHIIVGEEGFFSFQENESDYLDGR